MIEATFTPTVDDQVTIFRRYSVRQYWGCLAVVAILVLALLCFFGLAIIALVTGDSEAASGFVIPGVLVLIGMLATIAGILIYIYSIQPRKAAQEFEKFERLRAEKTCRFSEEGITIKTPFGEDQIRWAIYQKVVDIDGHYLLILANDRQRFFAVPKRAFASAEHEEMFRSLSKQRIGKANY
ncbi:MAG: YcxB family protein [Anaerolineae bacterium]|nr:YcxB family protein [Anaerolineae bacterium]